MSDGHAPHDIPHAELAAQIGRLQGAFEEFKDHTESAIDRIATDVSDLKRAAYMGRGAWWALTKVGGVLLLLTMAGAWLWQRARGLFQ